MQFLRALFSLAVLLAVLVSIKALVTSTKAGDALLEWIITFGIVASLVTVLQVLEVAKSTYSSHRERVNAVFLLLGKAAVIGVVLIVLALLSTSGRNHEDGQHDYAPHPDRIRR